MTARDIETLKRLTTKLTETEVRREFLKRMVKKKVGLREEEEFLDKEKLKQAQLGVPHSRIQVELGFIFQA